MRGAGCVKGNGFWNLVSFSQHIPKGFLHNFSNRNSTVVTEPPASQNLRWSTHYKYFAILNSLTTFAMKTFHTACNLLASHTVMSNNSQYCHHILLSKLEKGLLKSTQHWFTTTFTDSPGSPVHAVSSQGSCPASQLQRISILLGDFWLIWVHVRGKVAAFALAWPPSQLKRSLLSAVSKYWVPMRVPSNPITLIWKPGKKSISYLKFLQYFVIFSVIFTKVFHFLAFRTASIVLHFCTLWVDFRAFGLITNRSILSTNAGTVGMPREKPFSQFVHKATVIHATLPSVVIKDQIVIAGGLVPFIGRVVFVVDGSRCDQARDYKQQYPGFMDVKSHPPPQLLHGISGPDRNSCFHKETSVVVWKQTFLSENSKY